MVGLAIIPLLAALAKLALWLVVLGMLLAALAVLAWVLFTYL